MTNEQMKMLKMRVDTFMGLRGREFYPIDFDGDFYVVLSKPLGDSQYWLLYYSYPVGRPEFWRVVQSKRVSDLQAIALITSDDPTGEVALIGPAPTAWRDR